MAEGEAGRGMEELRDWLVKQVATEIEADPAKVDPRAPFSALGIDSAGAVTITVALERRTGLKLSPALAWDYPTIDELAAHVASLLTSRAKGTP